MLYGNCYNEFRHLYLTLHKCITGITAPFINETNTSIQTTFSNDCCVCQVPYLQFLLSLHECLLLAADVFSEHTC